MEEIHDIEGQLEPEPPPGPGAPWGGIIWMVGLVIVVVFAVQNNETVTVDFLWLTGQWALSVVILVTAVTVAVFTSIGGVLYRRRRVKRRVEKQELRRLRGDG